MATVETSQPAEVGNRRKTLVLSVPFLLHLAKHGIREAFEQSGSPVPHNAKVVDAFFDPQRNELRMVLESEEFDPVHPHLNPPVLEATYRNIPPEATEPRCWICGRPATRFALNASRTEFSDPCCEDHRPERARL